MPSVNGEPLAGIWFDRTKEYSARYHGKTNSPGQFATPETVTLSPLPCWEHLSPDSALASSFLSGRLEPHLGLVRLKEGLGVTRVARGEVFKL